MTFYFPDFEKDENGNTDNIDRVPVLGFLWQLMILYQQKYFKNNNLDKNETKGLSKEGRFILNLQMHAAEQLRGIYEMNETGEVKLGKNFL